MSEETQEKNELSKYLSKQASRNRMGCLSILLFVGGCSVALQPDTYESGGGLVVVFAFMAAGLALGWNFIVKPFFTQDKAEAQQVREDMEKWVRGEIKSDFDTVFKIFATDYFKLEATYEHDEIDNKTEMDIPLLKYGEKVGEGDNKQMSKFFTLNWTLTKTSKKVVEYFYISRWAKDDDYKMSKENNFLIYANGKKYFFYPIEYEIDYENADTGGFDMTNIVPLSKDYFSSALLEDEAMESKDFVVRVYFQNGMNETIELGQWQGDKRKKIVNGLWAANLLSRALEGNSPLRNFVDSIEEPNDSSQVDSSALEKSVDEEEVKQAFSSDAIKNAFESIKNEGEKEKS